MKTPWLAPYPVRTAAAALLFVALVGGGTVWWSLRGRSSQTVWREETAAIIAALTADLARPTLEAEVAELLDPKTSHSRRLDIYRSWRDLERTRLQPLVWWLGKREMNPSARAVLYTWVPDGPGAYYPAVIEAARTEWANGALDPLWVLITKLRHFPERRTQELFLEILAAGPEADPLWFSGILSTIQSTFPKSPAVNEALVKHRHPITSSRPQ